MKNEEMISCLREIGLNEFKEKYTLKERPIGEKFKELTVNGVKFNINQYEVVGVGNISFMDCATPFFQMLTYIVTPFYKDVPMFSSDFILKGNKHDVINELYSLVIDKDNALYKEYLEKFKENMASCKLQDNEVKPDWCDSYRPTYVNKTGTDADDEAIINLFKHNIELLIEYEQKCLKLEGKDMLLAKNNAVSEYVNKLVEKGGISTNMFKAALGIEQTREFFTTILFGNESYKPTD